MKVLKHVLTVALIAVLLGQGCTKGVSQEAQKLAEKRVIEIWGVIDDEDAYNQVWRSFRTSFPYATIDFKRFRLEEYEEELLNALAEDRGPDVYMVHNTWIGKYEPKILPQPPTVKLAQQVVTGTVKKELTIQVSDVRTVSPSTVRKEFVDAVGADVIRSVDVGSDPKKPTYEDRVLALPTSVDTLALYYNKDLLNAAGIAQPPVSWDQFQEQVSKLVVIDDVGGIVQAGAGFGTGRNVERAADILSLLMIQNRTQMVDDRGTPRFHVIPPELNDQVEEPPAYSALRFYTDFANPGKNVYTWNDDQPNSLDAFTQGTSAFFLGYSYHLPLIRSRAPKLNVGITEVPQIAGNPKANYANYWAWTVSKKTESPDLSWYLVNYMTDAEHAAQYVEVAKRPAARRALIDVQLDDPDVGVFASQVLTSKSWYRGTDPRAMEQAMIEMIESVVNTDLEINKAVKIAVDTIAQTIQYRR